jgi:biopolymer transport protein ExbD
LGAALGNKGAFSDINMTPLIDIVLVVLIIMMVNIPIQIEEMGLNLPMDKPITPPPPPNPDQLVIALYEHGEVALNRRIMKDEELFYEITRRLKPMTNKIVFIDAHPLAQYGLIVDLMDTAREAGAEKVAFAKMKDMGPLEATEVSPGSMPRGVTFGSPSVVGEMTEKRAYERFEPLQATINGCYATALGTNPAIVGRAVLRVDVGPQGELMDVSIQTDTTNDKALTDCVQQTAGSLKFEELGEAKTARIQYPFLFSPG